MPGHEHSVDFSVSGPPQAADISVVTGNAACQAAVLIQHQYSLVTLSAFPFRQINPAVFIRSNRLIRYFCTTDLSNISLFQFLSLRRQLPQTGADILEGTLWGLGKKDAKIPFPIACHHRNIHAVRYRYLHFHRLIIAKLHLIQACLIPIHFIVFFSDIKSITEGCRSVNAHFTAVIYNLVLIRQFYLYRFIDCIIRRASSSPAAVLLSAS